MTWRSIVERIDFPEYDMLDAMIASALKKQFDTHVHFRKRVCVERQRAQTYDRFLRGRQVAYMIYEHFRATRLYEPVQALSNLFSISLQIDDVNISTLDGSSSIISNRHAFRPDPGTIVQV